MNLPLSSLTCLSTLPFSHLLNTVITDDSGYSTPPSSSVLPPILLCPTVLHTTYCTPSNWASLVSDLINLWTSLSLCLTSCMHSTSIWWATISLSTVAIAVLFCTSPWCHVPCPTVLPFIFSPSAFQVIKFISVLPPTPSFPFLHDPSYWVVLLASPHSVIAAVSLSVVISLGISMSSCSMHRICGISTSGYRSMSSVVDISLEWEHSSFHFRSPSHSPSTLTPVAPEALDSPVLFLWPPCPPPPFIDLSSTHRPSCMRPCPSSSLTHCMCSSIAWMYPRWMFGPCR